MFALLAAFAFALALIFHIAGGSVDQYVLTAELAGLLLAALHLAFGIGWGWWGRGRGPQQAPQA